MCVKDQCLILELDLFLQGKPTTVYRRNTKLFHKLLTSGHIKNKLVFIIFIFFNLPNILGLIK